MMLNAGDRVELVKGDIIDSTGNILFAGERGMVIGFKGKEFVIVSWGSTPPYRTAQCHVQDVVIVHRGASH